MTSKPDASRDAEWKSKLDTQQYQVTRCSATERPFTGKYWDHKGVGMYKCVCCGTSLFKSDTKFDSGTGWPSFTDPAVAEAVELHTDRSYGMSRTEVICKHCGGHLGHVFADGPGASGERYCINGCALTLEPKAE